MKRQKWFQMIVALLLIGILVGCNTPAPTATVAAPTATAAAAPTNTPAPTATTATAATPTSAPTNTPAAEAKKLLLATTTSTQDSGLLEYLLPDFEAQYNVEVDVVAVGTGQAMTLGEDGNADVLLVHARAREDAFMEAKHGVRREDVMYNDFIILGPESDPAGIKGMTGAAQAFSAIAQTQSPFVSRGDDSGTHTKEKAVWAAAEIEPAGDWYISAGQGMGAVLTMADEQEAYTLSDRATYLARTLEGTELQILVEGDPVLFNPYGVIAVNPNKGPHIQLDLANQFIDWIVSLPTQEKIAAFGLAEFGAPLFTPDSALWREAHPQAEAPVGGIPADAALKITGLVDNEIGWTEEQVRAMETIESQSTNKQGEVSTYTGVSLQSLLALAGVQDGATTLVMVADDGYSAEVPLADLESCPDCIVSFRSQGGFSTVLPGFPGNVQVKGVVELQVK